MIFISIASYKDQDLLNTIASLNKNADNPDQLRIVVLNQSSSFSSVNTPPFSNVEMFYIDSSKSKGVCWARKIIQSLAGDEDYYMQIDAHMRVAKGWDTKMIHYLNVANSQKPILSFYPPGFEDNWSGDFVVRNIIRGVGTGAVSSINEILDPAKFKLENGPDMPIRSYTTAAGFLFAPIEFLNEVPIDPKLYWNFEETDITLRAYTNGWDFFSTPEPIIWHRYNTTGKMIHMEESSVWLELENISNEHAPKKYHDPNYNYPAKYMLGNKRSLKSYEILNNINLRERITIGKANKKMLVVVPYRDREEHLREYLIKVPSFLSDKSCDILLCELESGCEWNAGLTVNSVINFMQKDNYEFIYISHVDVYPCEGWEWPEEGTFISDMGDVGSCLLRMEDFLKVGGYGNNFWGWGGEDDNLYNKLATAGIQRVKSSITFDTKYQNHERPFNGVNYTNNLRELYKPIDNKEIFNTNKLSITHSLEQIGDNIYKQVVKYTSVRPKHKKAVIGYIKDVKEFKYINPWVKSAIFYGDDYDVWMVVLDDAHCKELNAYGVNVYKHEQKDSYVFIDRFMAFREFLQKYPYEEVIHVDVTDSYFQSNPFKNVSGNLAMVSEDITFKECNWNTSMILGNYGYTYPDNQVLCGGVIYGTRNEFIGLCENIEQEYNKLSNPSFSSGSDQAIINELVYSGRVTMEIINSDKPLAIHLHHVLNGNNKNAKIEGITVLNNNNERFSIVHQYNRDITLYNNVLNHFESFFYT